MNLIEQLKTYKLHNNLTQKQLSELLGVSLATIEHWFSGVRIPNEMHALRIEKLLLTSIEPREEITIPDAVLKKITTNQPEFKELVLELKRSLGTRYVGTAEKRLADNVLTTCGGRYLTQLEVYALSKCSAGLPYNAPNGD